MTAWHTCRAAELQDVDGYVFQESSMSPSTSNLEVRNKLQVLLFLGPALQLASSPSMVTALDEELHSPPHCPRLSQPVT